MESLSYTLMPSPVGELLIVGDAAALRYVSFQDGRFPMEVKSDWKKVDSRNAHSRKGSAPVAAGAEQLKEYFARERTTFDMPLAPEGTAFQKAVWEELRRIPYGETISYGEQARRIRNPRSSRAVGAANGRNPLAIVIPCHRVIGSTGSLTGFGGGLKAKEFLLDFERQTVESSSRLFAHSG